MRQSFCGPAYFCYFKAYFCHFKAMREWRNHTSQAAHHSLEERSHRLNTMSAIYRQISEIIQGAVRGLSPGKLQIVGLNQSRDNARVYSFAPTAPNHTWQVDTYNYKSSSHRHARTSLLKSCYNACILYTVCSVRSRVSITYIPVQLIHICSKPRACFS